MSVNTNNSPSQDNTTNPDDHSNHNIDPPGFKPFTVIDNIIINKNDNTNINCPCRVSAQSPKLEEAY